MKPYLKVFAVLALIAGGLWATKYYFFTEKKFTVTDDQMYLFRDKIGPETLSTVKKCIPTSWKKYNSGENYGIGILLSDTASSWLGLVHAFKSFGIPFKVHTKVEEAMKHDMVMVYPMISGNVFTKKELKQMDAFLKKGKTLVGFNVLGGLTEDFGIGGATPSKENYAINIIDTANVLLKEFTSSIERKIMLGRQSDFEEVMGTYSYQNTALIPLLSYESGEACMTQYYFRDGGRAFALGLDLGEYIMRYENGRTYNAHRTYVNGYEPSIDVLIRLLNAIYRSASSTAVKLNTVPYNKALTVCITHDIDYTKSVKNTLEYAKLEKENNIEATYFIQTKYIRDWNDDIFFDKKGASILKQVHDMGMEIASHSVAHSKVYSKFPIGDGNEKYPEYRPFVKDRYKAEGGTVLGELRVSKYLLENCIPGVKVESFRPGHLSYPFALPECLLASNYKYSSSITANLTLTHLPFQLMYKRGYEQELEIFEFPVTVEDEKMPRLDLRLQKSLDLANEISKYGGFMNVLIHTDTVGYKYSFEKGFIEALKQKACFMSIRKFASWWVKRNALRFWVKAKGNKRYQLTIAKTKHTLYGISFTVPDSWQLENNPKGVRQSGNQILIDKLNKQVNLTFTKTSN